MKSNSREQAELKVVEYAKSVNWDFDRVFEKVNNSDDILTYDEYLLLDAGDSGRMKNIFDKYAPKEEEFKWGEEVIYYNKTHDTWENAIYVNKNPSNIDFYILTKDGYTFQTSQILKSLTKIELTKQQIAEKFGIPVEQLVIKD